MIGLVLAVLLGVTQAGAETAPAAAPTAQVSAAPADSMHCEYKNRRLRMCTTGKGEVLRCQRQALLGSRFETWVCLTYEEDQTIQRDSHDALDRQQHITTPSGG